jgi:hypothetical protein
MVSPSFLDPRNLPLILEANRLREACRLAEKAAEHLQKIARLPLYKTT